MIAGLLTVLVITTTPNDTVRFNFTGATQVFTVSPTATYTTLKITCYGAAGGPANNGFNASKGGVAEGILFVEPGQELYIEVGGAGGARSTFGGGAGGYNGGGSGSKNFGGTGGGGATDVRTSDKLDSRLIVAGGGGGSQLNGHSGGAGGGLDGTSACPRMVYSSRIYGGAGGGQTNGGDVGKPTAGMLGKGGDGVYAYAAGGGGGYFGGGAGLPVQAPPPSQSPIGGVCSSGGGGSGFVGGVVHGFTSEGVNEGDGYVAIQPLPVLITPAAPPPWRPVVLVHGLLATSEAMSHAVGWITSDFPGIHVHNAVIAGDTKAGSLLTPMDKQIDELAAVIRGDPKLARGFNLIGHSQGGLLTRGYIERYNDPPGARGASWCGAVLLLTHSLSISSHTDTYCPPSLSPCYTCSVFNYISWAGPHDGVYGVPDFNAICPNVDCPWLDDLVDQASANGPLSKITQELFTFFSYWKSPMNYTIYLANNTFLADLNNERTVKNSTYKANMASLNTMLLLTASEDLIVVPKESTRFEFYAEHTRSHDAIVPLTNSTAYVEDWIGLRTLHEMKKLKFLSVPCGHQDVPRETCKNHSYIGLTKSLLENTLPPSRPLEG